MTIENCRDIAKYEDNGCYVKALYIGMTASFGKAYAVYAHIHGQSCRFYFNTEYEAKQFFEKICFFVDQKCSVNFLQKR